MKGGDKNVDIICAYNETDYAIIYRADLLCYVIRS